MKTLASILLLFTIISIISISPSAFAAEVSVSEGSGVPGCEDTDECWFPSTLTVAVGETVTWINDDTAAHTVTAGDLGVDSDTVGLDFPNGFDSSIFMAGVTFDVTFDTAGTFPYFCMVHPWMVGTVIVEEAMAEEVMEEEVMEETMEEEVMEETMEEEVMEETMEEEMMEETMEETMEEEMMEIESTDEAEGGGCLIATAAFGTELAPQVQFLREIRDNTVMSTSSGATFMTGFNQLYYSFSPTIADMERDNPMFQEAVRAFITPMISTLSIMTLAEDGNDVQVLGLGISVIALNLGMYIAAPAVAGFALSKRLKSRN